MELAIIYSGEYKHLYLQLQLMKKYPAWFNRKTLILANGDMPEIVMQEAKQEFDILDYRVPDTRVYHSECLDRFMQKDVMYNSVLFMHPDMFPIADVWAFPFRDVTKLKCLSYITPEVPGEEQGWQMPTCIFSIDTDYYRRTGISFTVHRVDRYLFEPYGGYNIGNCFYGLPETERYSYDTGTRIMGTAMTKFYNPFVGSVVDMKDFVHLTGAGAIALDDTTYSDKGEYKDRMNRELNALYERFGIVYGKNDTTH